MSHKKAKSLIIIFAATQLLFLQPAFAGFLQESSTVSIKEIKASVRKAFGNRLKVADERNPFYLLGDFNGDGLQDTAVVVHTGKSVAGLSKRIKVLNPWLDSLEDTGDPDEPIEVSELALAIIHASKTIPISRSSARFLLLDSVSEYGGIFQIYNAESEKTYSLEPPPKRKGESIYTGTEDANGIIYWDGKTYRWDQQGD